MQINGDIYFSIHLHMITFESRGPNACAPSYALYLAYTLGSQCILNRISAGKVYKLWFEDHHTILLNLIGLIILLDLINAKFEFKDQGQSSVVVVV